MLLVPSPITLQCHASKYSTHSGVRAKGGHVISNALKIQSIGIFTDALITGH